MNGILNPESSYYTINPIKSTYANVDYGITVQTRLGIKKRKMEEQMTLNYDETDDFDEADDFDETDDFDEEPEEEFPEEEDDNPNTALSQAFREARETIDDYDDAEDDESEEEDEDEDDADVDTPDADTDADADADADADTYAQRLVEPIDPLADEEDLDDLDLDIEPPPLKLPATEVEPFRPQEQSNFAYAEAVTAFYEEKNYQRAIEKFGEAIEYEVQHTEDEMSDSNEVVAKSKYWQAEAYIKLHDLPQALGTLEDLVKTCQGHYLVLAAERRVDELNAKDS